MVPAVVYTDPAGVLVPCEPSTLAEEKSVISAHTHITGRQSLLTSES